jgi:hypothetical protein
MNKYVDHALSKTCKQLAEEMGQAGAKTAQEELECQLRDRVEDRLISAAWTLRRMPDKENAFLFARQSLWPETVPNKYTAMPKVMGVVRTRSRIRPTALEIDQMQPALDLLLLLPDLKDRQLLFWAAWHQAGERQVRIPWAKVRQSMAVDLSRWTLKRRYDDGLKWLAAIIALQA